MTKPGLLVSANGKCHGHHRGRTEQPYLPSECPGMTQPTRSTRPRTSPTVLRWELGARLRTLRTRADLSIEDAARELMCSQAKVSRMETAGRGIQPRDVRDLCRLYRVSDDVRDELIKMAHEAKAPGWWQQYGTLDEQTATYIGLEAAATSISALESRVFPGLLQTADYSRTLLEGLVPAESVEDLVDTRQRRAERLHAGEVILTALLDEAIFLRTLARPDVMIEQVAHLLTCAALPNVTLQVIPLSAKPHPGIYGSFMHLAFGGRQLLDVIYFEGLSGHTFVDRPTEVEKHVNAYEASRNQALSPEKSLGWLRQQAMGGTTPSRRNAEQKRQIRNSPDK